jgi:hypothetical protein
LLDDLPPNLKDELFPERDDGEGAGEEGAKDEGAAANAPSTPQKTRRRSFGSKQPEMAKAKAKPMAAARKAAVAAKARGRAKKAAQA